MTDASSMFSAVGKALPRADGRLKVTGAATYAAEWHVPNLAYGAVVDSSIARGSIRSIDPSAALKAPGVTAVVTHENVPRLRGFADLVGGQQMTGDGGLGETRLPLQDAVIHYGGQAVAVVVAETPEQARYAATLVRVAYDEQPPELDMDTATRKPFPAMFAGSEPLQKKTDTARPALEAAPVRLSLEYVSAIQHHNPIELLSTTAIWDRRGGEDHLTVYDTTRGVYMLRDVLARSFDVPPANVRVVSQFIGGAFGSKAWTLFNPMLAALTANVAKRPVKIEWRRQQMFSVAGHRPSLRQTVSLGATLDGRIPALIHDSRTHSSPVSGYVEFGARTTRMMYGIPDMGFSNQVSFLNLPSPCTMRGPGFLMGGWALESAMDELASELELDPIELRLRNYAEVNPDGGLPFSSKNLRQCYERGKVLFGWDVRHPKPRANRVGNNLVGYGMSSVMHPADRLAATARATIFADGTAVVRSATHELGNGAYTVFGQIAADGLGLPVERVRFELGDTDFPAAPPTLGSMTTASVGPAVFEAAQRSVTALKELAVRDPGSPLFKAALDTIEAHDGRLHLHGQPSVGEEYGTILRRAGLAHIAAGSDAAPGEERKQFAFFSFGAVFAEVRVDEATGVVRVARLCGVYDVGRQLNPRTVHSQIMGGMIFGLGAALTEETVFDARNGLPVIRNLADYHVPSCADTPDISIEVLDIPDPHMGELGAHGCG